jgi:hypothetical protein
MPTQITHGAYTFDLEMPDLPAVLLAAGRIPDPLTAAVVVLLAEEGSIPTNPDDPHYFARQTEQIRGMYAVLELCCVAIDGDPSRRFRAFGASRPGDLGPMDVGYNLASQVYWGFFRGGYRGPAAPDTADPAQSDGAAEPLSPGDDAATE